jgi:hypothetical protein
VSNSKMRILKHWLLGLILVFHLSVRKKNSKRLEAKNSRIGSPNSVRALKKQEVLKSSKSLGSSDSESLELYVK